MVIVLLLLACAGDKAAVVTPTTPTVPEADPVALLTRASLDLRGVRPSEDEIARIESGDSTFGALVDEYMADERFETQIVSMYGEVFLTPSESFQVPVGDYAELSSQDRPEYNSSIGQEPLRILGRIAAEDLPYTDLVTGDWTMSNDMLRTIWPVESTGGSTGWQPSAYTDGRPTSGALSTNGLWWRFSTTSANLNRKRANQISRIFLCHDYLTRPIEFDRNVNLLDQDAVEDAINNDPGCIACHVSLDPIASYLFGFWYFDDQSSADASVYHPERELLWQSSSGVAPGYYGQSGSNLEQLGHQLAGDPRFVECAVEHAFTRLMRRPVALDDTDALTVHREVFLSGGLTVRALFRSIVEHPRYVPLTHEDQSTVDGQVTRKMVTAEQLATQVEALTGFTWTSNGYDMMRTDAVGVGNLAGRADGFRMSRHISSPNTTLLLVQERLAQASAVYLIQTEMAQAQKNRTLFTEADLSLPVDADHDAAVAQLQALHLRVLSRRVEADGPEVAANLALWEELYAADENPTLAWAGVLTALLRDPDFILY
jgi:hypothetical protein